MEDTVSRRDGIMLHLLQRTEVLAQVRELTKLLNKMDGNRQAYRWRRLARRLLGATKSTTASRKELDVHNSELEVLLQNHQYETIWIRRRDAAAVYWMGKLFEGRILMSIAMMITLATPMNNRIYALITELIELKGFIQMQ